MLCRNKMWYLYLEMMDATVTVSHNYHVDQNLKN